MSEYSYDYKNFVTNVADWRWSEMHRFASDIYDDREKWTDPAEIAHWLLNWAEEIQGEIEEVEAHAKAAKDGDA